MPETSKLTLTLEIRQPDRPARTETLRADRTIIGRESGELILDDPEASAVHAELDCSTGHVIVRDLGSSNGTWRSGKRLPQFALFRGQSFVIGSTQLVLRAVQGGLEHPEPGQTASGRRGDVIDEDEPRPDRITLMGIPSADRPTPASVESPGWRRPTDAGTPPPAATTSLPPSVTRTLPAQDRVAGPRPPTSSTDIPQMGQPAPSFPTSTAEFESSRTLPHAARTANSPPDDTDERSAADPSPGKTLPAGVRASPVLATADGSVSVPTTGASDPPTDPFAETRGLDDVFRPPVPNAVIKDGTHGRSGGTPTRPPGQPSRTARTWLVTGGGVALAAVVAFGLIYLLFELLGAREIAFVRAAARELPEEAVGFVALSSPGDVIELFGDSASQPMRERARQALSFDPWSERAWVELGVDPDASVSIGLLDPQTETFAVSFGVADRGALESALSDPLGNLVSDVTEARSSRRCPIPSATSSPTAHWCGATVRSATTKVVSSKTRSGPR